MTARDASTPTTAPDAPEPDAPELDAPAPLDPIGAEKAEANRLMISGAAIGALDVLAIAALGVGCPLCAIGAPALVGWGAWRWYKVRQLEQASREDASHEDEPTRTGAARP
jgi:hypothetical protein